MHALLVAERRSKGSPGDGPVPQPRGYATRRRRHALTAQSAKP